MATNDFPYTRTTPRNKTIGELIRHAEQRAVVASGYLEMVGVDAASGCCTWPNANYALEQAQCALRAALDGVCDARRFALYDE